MTDPAPPRSRPRSIGFNHVATITPDLDRLVGFYEEVFDARLIAYTDGWEGHPRMAIIHMGAGAELNVFEADADTIIGDRTAAGGRGPIDHFAVMVESEADLEDLRDVLVARGSSPGEITDFGNSKSVFFRDPDGMELEVVWNKDDFDPLSITEPQRFGPPAEGA
jgi:catechol 2,3-dioxygenase-like lactoylglutathione lyase family enzyme